jgi:hypothetical protein
MLCFAAALSGFFWMVPWYFTPGARAGAWVRGLGECAVLSYLTVPFTPSELFGDIHAWLSLLSGALGISAAVCAVYALLDGSRAARALGFFGVLTLGAGFVHAALFVCVHFLRAGEPASSIVPAVQKVAASLLSAWMLAVAWLTLSRRHEIGR